MAYQHQNEQKFPSLLDALYCEEEQWEEIERDDCFIEEEEESSFNDNVGICEPISLLEQDLFWEDGELCTLLKKEQDFDFSNGFLKGNPLMLVARNDAVEWMLKVSAYYYFSAATTVLAVTYLDRFLFLFESNGEKKKPWMTQLAAVACLSVAAKVEESDVPLLLDLQVEESKYVFEAKTIQRMEILVLSTLQWRMNLVTPLSFVDYISRRLGLRNHACWEFLRRCECLLLSLLSDCRFICYLPSVTATATMLHVFRFLEPCLGVEYQDELLGILGIDKEKVDECYKVISKIASTFHLHSINKRKFNRAMMPGSPKGVMDVSFSSDSSNDAWSVATSVSSSPEPLMKRARTTTLEEEEKQQLGEEEEEEEVMYHDATSDPSNI